MNPSDPSTFHHETAILSTGRTYHYVDQKPQNFVPSRTLTILCVHGFPDCWYGWRYQIGPWVRKGYRVVVPDMLGYGGTDKPKDVTEYTSKKLCRDLSALLDHIKIKRAIVIGHDWGSFIVGRFALWHPERLLALIIMAVPYTPPRPDYLSLEDIAKNVPNYGYQLYFADPSSTTEIESKLTRFICIMYGRLVIDPGFVYEGKLRGIVLGNEEVPGRNPKINEEELKYYVEQLKEMHGPLSYYRTTDLRFKEEQAANLPSKLPDDLPVFYIWGTKDPTTTPGSLKVSRMMIPKFEEISLEGVGHWVMVEAKDEVCDKVMDWLSGLNLGSGEASKL